MPIFMMQSVNLSRRKRASCAAGKRGTTCAPVLRLRAGSVQGARVSMFALALSTAISAQLVHPATNTSPLLTPPIHEPEQSLIASNQAHPGQEPRDPTNVARIISRGGLVRVVTGTGVPGRRQLNLD